MSVKPLEKNGEKKTQTHLSRLCELPAAPHQRLPHLSHPRTTSILEAISIVQNIEKGLTHSTAPSAEMKSQRPSHATMRNSSSEAVRRTGSVGPILLSLLKDNNLPGGRKGTEETSGTAERPLILCPPPPSVSSSRSALVNKKHANEKKGKRRNTNPRRARRTPNHRTLEIRR